jgi:threonine-phosphate decarboxylase
MRKLPCTPVGPASLYQHGDAAGRFNAELLDFSVSINPLGPPRSVLLALSEATASLIGHYPDPGCRQLVEKLARYHDVAIDQIVVGNGSNELIYAAARAFRPRRTAIVEPTYTEYLRATLHVNAAVDHWLADEPDFALEPFDPQEADVVWLANPNNPTGRLWPPGYLLSWIQDFPQTVFIVDEAFLPFRPDEGAHSLIPAVHSLPNLVVLRSLTKVYAIPGLRLGYAIMDARHAAAVRDNLVPWSVNALAQAAGIAALEDDSFLAQTRSWFAKEAVPFPEQLRRVSSALNPVRSDANFVLVRLRNMPSSKFVKELLVRGVAVRDAANFVGLDHHYVRIAARTLAHHARLLAALHETCAGQ